ncbi:MAG: Hsp20/alpha crystallin family protein [Patescibacteria group bacterium]|nr:Hsp20/alpha crystallin family protein [Patescibacteria group bacterium]
MGDSKMGLFKKSDTKQKELKKIKPEELNKNLLPRNWIEEEEEEGELLVDVYQEGNNVVIRSTVAGVHPEDIDIDINNDMITIRGKRKESSVIDEGDYFYKECYWGSFSRSIILPCEVQASKVKAALKDGVLTVVLPKILKEKSIRISVERK